MSAWCPRSPITVQVGESVNHTLKVKSQFGFGNYHPNPGSPVVAEPRVGAVPLLHGRGAPPGQVRKNGGVGSWQYTVELETKAMRRFAKISQSRRRPLLALSHLRNYSDTILNRR